MTEKPNNEHSASTDCYPFVPDCIRDTDGNGDCHRCAKHSGCPMGLFRRCHIEAAMMNDPEQIRAFKRNAEHFEYREWLGVVRGWRHRDGRVLVEQCEPAAN